MGRKFELSSQNLLINAKRVIIKIWWVTNTYMDNKIDVLVYKYTVINRAADEAYKKFKVYTYPASISKMRMPKAHQSTALEWPLLVIISGARYSGVPHKVQVLKRKYLSE